MFDSLVVPYIGTWIETRHDIGDRSGYTGRTLYRYVDWNLALKIKATIIKSYLI